MVVTTWSSQHLSLRRRHPCWGPPASVDLHSGVWTTEKKVANFKGRVMPAGWTLDHTASTHLGWAMETPKDEGGWTGPQWPGLHTRLISQTWVHRLPEWALQTCSSLLVGLFVHSFSPLSVISIELTVRQRLERQPEEMTTPLPPSELVFRREKWNNGTITMQSRSDVPGGVDTWAGSTRRGCLPPTPGRSERLPRERGVFSLRSRPVQAGGWDEARRAACRERVPWEAPGSARVRRTNGLPWQWCGRFP